ncbi:MAG: glycosyl transferase family 2 [Candidatus Cryptobacteroides sp.]
MRPFEYTAVIRTLGMAGKKYQMLLDSVAAQTIKPKEILVYIAEGYSIPKETVGSERYIFVKKGMVAQRALPYDEVDTEYILFLDDDVYLPSGSVETLYKEMTENSGNIISPCVFSNHKAPIMNKVRTSLMGREVCRFFGNNWAFKVLRTGGFSYNNHPGGVLKSQSNAGPCFLCSKSDFRSIHFEEETWLDDVAYAYPEDQVMFYKMYKKGLKILTSFDSGIEHLDAGSSGKSSEAKTLNVVYSEYRNKLIFWYRFIYLSENNYLGRIWSLICLGYVLSLQFIKYSILRMFGKSKIYAAFIKGLADGRLYIKSQAYLSLPPVI